MWYRPVHAPDEYDSLSLMNPEADIPRYLEMFTEDSRFMTNIPWLRFDVKMNSQNNPGDFPAFVASSDLVLTLKSWEVLKYLIKKDIKLTVLKTELADYYWVKIMNMMDCLDYENSKYRIRKSGKVSVEKYVFVENLVAGKHLFYLPKASHNVVSQTFKDTVERFELKGLIFRELC